MTQRWMSPNEREAQAAEELAERLDSLSRPLAERVLGRAIELDDEARAEAEAAAQTIDFETLKGIALEVGISEEALREALLEELDTEKDHDAKPLERFTTPRMLRGGVVIAGDKSELEGRLGAHLEGVQGLSREHQTGIRTVWTTSEAPARTVEEWMISQSRGHRQLVELDVGTKSVRAKAWVWVIGLLILGALFGRALGALAFFAIVFFGFGAVVTWMRRITSQLRKGINAALWAVGGKDPSDPPDTWLELWERLD